MKWLKKLIASIREYRSEPTLNDCPDAPDAEAVNNALFDQQEISGKFERSSKKS